MEPWHNENCDMKFCYENKKGVRGFWCNTHRQWTYLFGKVHYTFEPHFTDKFLKDKESN